MPDEQAVVMPDEPIMCPECGHDSEQHIDVYDPPNWITRGLCRACGGYCMRRDAIYLAHIRKLREENAKAEQRMECGHRFIDWDDSYGACVLCTIIVMAHEHDDCPDYRAAIEKIKGLERYEVKEDAYDEGLTVVSVGYGRWLDFDSVATIIAEVEASHAE